MTTLATGSSVTLTVGDNGYVVVATNGGFATVAATPTGGAVQTVSLGPSPERRKFGPYSEGASVALTNVSCASLDYDYNAADSGLTSTEAATVRALMSGGGNTYIRWCCPGKDTSGTLFKDVSGRGNDATIDASNSAPFAVDNRLSTVVHASAGGVTQSLAASAADFATDSIIQAVAFTNEDPAASEVLFSWGSAAAAGFPGFYFSHRSSAAGVGRAVGIRGNGVAVSGSDSAVKFSNAGGTRETHALIAYDAPTGSLYLYRDGVLTAANAGLMTGANAFTQSVVTAGARLGGMASTSSTVAGIYRGWQGYVFSRNGLPINIGRIAALLAESPSTPLRDSEFAF